MVKGFKEFIMRGNLVELAVAFIIATAFAAVVKAFVGVIMASSARRAASPTSTTMRRAVCPWASSSPRR